jgi:hypothetical protein
MANDKEKKAYQKPEVRQIKLSLAELTLGSNCHDVNPQVVAPFCTVVNPQCNI